MGVGMPAGVASDDLQLAAVRLAASAMPESLLHRADEALLELFDPTRSASRIALLEYLLAPPAQADSR
ncbi:hypothetical protein PAPYR_8365 [Paratrimastix pyriformis]|uniref:Uncharacterized protein n=1 Tax=Paratrimastix pyriformis TaxID=342808 RepID=A0ABQ8UAR7_9EUKA|nr:hypothetical protein PAPYR_8365 [Paratrimastix pyriformis]